MPRPEVDIDQQRRLFDTARDVADNPSPNLSHAEALAHVLDYIENLEENTEENTPEPDFQIGRGGSSRDGFM